MTETEWKTCGQCGERVDPEMTQDGCRDPDCPCQDSSEESELPLNYAAGKCSAPMWMNEIPAGHCGKIAFGVRPPAQTHRNAGSGMDYRDDGKYAGYVPGLACKQHGGPPCPGLEIEPGVFSGCDQSGGDCPTCGL